MEQFNWYVLKPIAIILVLLILTILQRKKYANRLQKNF